VGANYILSQTQAVFKSPIRVSRPALGGVAVLARRRPQDSGRGTGHYLRRRGLRGTGGERPGS